MMNLRVFASFTIALLCGIGCAAPAEDSGASIDALEQTEPPRATADELAAEVEAHFTEVNTAMASPLGRSAIFFQVDGDPVVRVEGDDAIVELPNPYRPPMLKVTAKSSPVFYVQRQGALAIGSHACRDVGGGVVIRTTELFRPAPDAPCTIAITKIYEETLSDHAIGVGLRPRTIIVGDVSATLTNESGVTHDVRGAFVLTQAGH
jgi:hypothetical protein